MKFLYKLLTLCAVLAAIAFATFFSAQNDQSVQLDLLVLPVLTGTLALWVIAAFALGGVLGILVSLGIILRQRAALASGKRQLSKAQAELDRLRTVGLTSE